jgi:hypothetical protein
MKAAGFCLLPAGWLLVLSALVLLKPGSSRGVFIVAGLAVEILGLWLVIHAHLIPHKPDRFLS